MHHVSIGRESIHDEILPIKSMPTVIRALRQIFILSRDAGDERSIRVRNLMMHRIQTRVEDIANYLKDSQKTQANDEIAKRELTDSGEYVLIDLEPSEAQTNLPLE